MSKVKAVVRQSAVAEEVIERPVLALAIVDISKAFNRLSASGLNERAIVCLVHEASGVGKPDIRAVLGGLRGLERDFCK